MNKTLTERVALGLRWSGASAILVSLVQFVELVALARLIRPTDFGLMGLAMVVIGFASVLSDFGMAQYIIHRPSLGRDELSSLFWLNVIAGLCGYFLLVILSPVAGVVLRDSGVTGVVVFAGVTVLISSFGNQAKVILQRDLKFNHLAVANLMSAVTGAAVSLPLAWTGFGVWALVGRLLAQTSVSAVAAYVFALPTARPKLHLSRVDLRPWRTFGVYQVWERLANQITTRLDYALLGTIAGPQALGYYDLGQSITVRPAQRIAPLWGGVAVAALAKVQGSPQALAAAYFRMLRSLAVVHAPILIMIAAVADRAVPLLFGEGWNSVVALVPPLSLVALFRALGRAHYSVLIATGRAPASFRSSALLLLVSAPAIPGGLALGGVVGMVYALAAAHAITNAITYVVLLRPFLHRSIRHYLVATLVPLGASLVMWYAMRSVPWLDERPAVAVLEQLVVGVAAYVGVMMLVGRNALVSVTRLMFARDVKDRSDSLAPP